MRISTIDLLSDRLDQDLAWRKKEVSTLSILIGGLQFEEQRAVLRGSFAVLYAHWEGFVKESFFYYMNFVQNQGIPASGLSDQVVAYCQRSNLSQFENQGMGSNHINMITNLRSNEFNRLKYHRSSRDINVNGNLSSKNFVTLMSFASIAFTKETVDTLNLIDNDLLKDRNAIAHGGDDEITLDTWTTVCKRVMELLGIVSEEILNSALDENYLRAK